jgi:hypothetical protein
MLGWSIFMPRQRLRDLGVTDALPLDRLREIMQCYRGGARWLNAG